ncbi:MAG: hypothetical protein H6736_20740 [Alphaproteobacteria bacterium]|nr:hypothetical protein [Alphaproteobacteria bacterium]
MPSNYQAQWTCRRCGAAGLLDESHRYCPSCGTRRHGEPSFFPDWDDLVSVAAHRFHGVAQPCCAQLWSEHAHHCGSCGRSLPATEGMEETFELTDLADHADLFEAAFSEGSLDDLLGLSASA